jgi:gamma-glutamylcysteine synthetase
MSTKTKMFKQNLIKSSSNQMHLILSIKNFQYSKNQIPTDKQTNFGSKFNDVTLYISRIDAHVAVHVTKYFKLHIDKNLYVHTKIIKNSPPRWLVDYIPNLIFNLPNSVQTITFHIFGLISLSLT